jgi:glycerol-3-phosphate acyltransferase PlsX
VARIAVDAMGGDKAPEEIVAGALEAASPQITPVLVGPAGLDTGGLELVEAQTTIAMDEKPADAVRAKRDSSLVVACRLVRQARRGTSRDPPTSRRQPARDRGRPTR